MSYLKEAFDAICDSELPDVWYVCLIERVPYYGGPEEGGWWGSDSHCVAYRKYHSKEDADVAAAAVEKLAAELEEEAKREYGDHCRMELDWLEARGLPADFLPEPDGPADYSVVVSPAVPADSHGPRHYS